MAFNLAKWDKLSMNVNPSLNNFFIYKTSDDAIATVYASGYFNSLKNVVKQGDHIYAYASDRFGILSVTSATGASTVTTAELTWTPAALADGYIWIGNAAGAPAPQIFSGDVTVSNAGVTAIGAKKVVASMVAAADTKLLVGGADGATHEFAVTGDITMSNGGVTTIGAKKVLASMVATADGKVLIGGADGATHEQTLTGDVTVTNGGVTAIGAKKVLASMVAVADTKFLIGGADGAAHEFTLTGDITNTNGGVTAIGSGKVLLAMLGSGIAPSHVVKYAGKENNGGGSPTIAITVAGVAATDVVFAQVQASTNAVNVQKVTPTTDTITVLLSGDPGASTIISYQALRAAS